MNIDFEVQEKIRKVRTKLLASDSLKLFGCLLYRFQINLIDCDSLTASCGISKIDKSLVINLGKKFISELKFKELIFLLVHEIMHFLYNHLDQKEGYDNIILNLANDHVINDKIRMDIANSTTDIFSIARNLEMLKDAFIVDKFKGVDATSYEVYHYLMKNVTYITITNSGDGDNNGGDSDAKQNQEIEITDQNGKKHKIKLDIKYSKEKKICKEITEELKTEVRSILETSRNKGNSPGRLIKAIMDLVKIEVPWDILLEKAISSTVVVSSNKSWKNINKRLYSAVNMILPYSDVEEQKDNLYLVIDTSGSILDRTLVKFFTVVKNSLEYFKNIVVITHDCVISGYTKIAADEFDMKSSDILKIKKGGTSHKDVFDRIEKDYEKSEDIGLVLLLTDFCSDIEEIYSNYKWVYEIPIKVIAQSKSDMKYIPREIDKNPILINEKK